MTRLYASLCLGFVVVACRTEDDNKKIYVEWDGYYAYFDIDPTAPTAPTETDAGPSDTSTVETTVTPDTSTGTAATDTSTGTAATDTTSEPETGGDTVVAPDGGCVEGAKACRCGPANECRQTGERLVCQDGWCVPETCPAGAEGCACYGNGTCDARDGVPMTCAGNVCAPTIVPAPGTVGGACGAGVACDDPLVCVSGRCEEPGCPSGTFGCACGSFGACAPYQGQATRCADGRCALGACEPGSPGCVCGAGDACAPATRCEEGHCVATGELRLVVRGAAQACDVTLDEGDLPRVEAITFREHVYGHSEIRSPRAALAFFTRDPGPLDGPEDGLVALITLKAGAPVAPPITIARAVCADALGRPDPTSSVTLE